MSATPELPPLTALQGSLHEITETLGSEVAEPTAIAPDWSQSQWLLARAAATIQGISSLLARSLRWQGPPGWQRFLTDQRLHTEGRHARIEALVERLDDAARASRIALV